jgi:hypothetical protein
MNKILLKTYKKYDDSEILLNVLNNKYDMDFALLLRRNELEFIENSTMFVEKLRELGVKDSDYSEKEIKSIFREYSAPIHKKEEYNFVITCLSFIAKSFKKYPVEKFTIEDLIDSTVKIDYPYNAIYINENEDTIILYYSPLISTKEEKELYLLQSLLNSKK